MNYKFLIAIRMLPESWIDEETRITRGPGETLIAANPKFTPIIFRQGEWVRLEIAAPLPARAFGYVEGLL